MSEIRDEESRPLSIDEEPGPKQTNQASGQSWRICHQQRELSGRIRIQQTRRLKRKQLKPEQNFFATFASCKGIGRKNARNASRKTSPAEMPRAQRTCRGSTSWRRTQKPNPSMLLVAQKTEWWMMMKNTDLKQPELILIESISQVPQPLPSKIGVFSKELDDSPHSSSSNYLKFVYCVHCHL